MKKIMLSLAVFSAALILSGCGYQSSAPANQPTSTKKPVSTSPSGQEAPVANQTNGSSVTIKNFAFSPQNMTVKVGTTVTWTNDDSATHTIKSVTFNSGDISTGGKFEFKFDKSGTYDYSCGIHPSMTGKIIVE
jgi:plastocyanin